MPAQKTRQNVQKSSRHLFYMEKKSPAPKRFWQIELRTKSTAVRYGVLGFAGCLLPSRHHRSSNDASKFVKRQILLKRRSGYVLKREKPKGVSKQKGGKGKKKTPKPKTNQATLRKQQQKNQTVKQRTKKKTAQVTNSDDSVAPPSLTKQDTLPAVNESVIKVKKAKTPSLSKQGSLTVGSGKVYIPPQKQWPVAMGMPLTWRYSYSGNAFGIYVDENICLCGHDDGRVVELDGTGKVARVYNLPAGVKCLTRDGAFLYAGCDNGALYDLTHLEPRKMCDIEDFGSIYWLDVLHGMICASDSRGNVALVNYEGEIIWKKQSSGDSGWMVRMDGSGIYHGYRGGVTKYSLQNGKSLWDYKGSDIIYFGVQDENTVTFAESRWAKKLDKETGKVLQTYNPGNLNNAYCNEAAAGLVFLCDCAHIRVCDEKSGKLVYQFNHPEIDTYRSGKHIMSMQYHQGRLYCVGTTEFKVLDLSESAIKAAQKKNPLQTVEIEMDSSAPVVSPMTRVDSVSSQEARGGIIVHCVKDKGKLRIRALSDGYNKKWNIQFPKVIRREGAKYLVQELKETKFFSGKYYRVFGDIKEIND